MSDENKQHQGEPVAWLACGELFKTVMGARNYAGSMPVYPLFKDVPVGSDMNAQCEDLRQAVRSREALIDDLRSQLAEAQQQYRDELGKRLAGEVKSEAKLAERDALLREKYMGIIDLCEDQSWWDRVGELLSLPRAWVYGLSENPNGWTEIKRSTPSAEE